MQDIDQDVFVSSTNTVISMHISFLLTSLADYILFLGSKCYFLIAFAKKVWKMAIISLSLCFYALDNGISSVKTGKFAHCRSHKVRKKHIN